MKTRYVIAASVLLSVSAFAQKDELKALKKISDKDVSPAEVNTTEYKALLDKAEPLMANATNEQKADFYYYKGEYALINLLKNTGNFKTAFPEVTENFNKVIEIEKGEKKKKRTEEIQKQIYPQMRAIAIQAAGELGKQNQFAMASPLYEAVYRMNPSDTLYLYNAAAYAVNGKDYKSALKYYEELDKIGFTGTAINYTAKDKDGKVEYYDDKKIRDMLIANKTHTNPGIFRESSKKGDIVKNIALIYIQQGETEKAKAAIANARKANPDDSGLITAQAELYLKTNDMDMYKKFINEAIQKNPNNADLFYNMGVVTSKENPDEAVKLYQKALEIDPKHINANINLGVLMLKDEQKIVDQMNKLGTSAADNKKYDQLKKTRDDMYKKSLSYFEKAYAIDPDNQTLLPMMASVYQALEMPAKAKEVKARMKK